MKLHDTPDSEGWKEKLNKKIIHRTWNSWAIVLESLRRCCWKAPGFTADPSGFKPRLLEGELKKVRDFHHLAWKFECRNNLNKYTDVRITNAHIEQMDP